MGDDKKKDDKKPADKDDNKKPADKKDDKKKPAASGLFSWNMTTKIGETTAMDAWNAYVKMPQAKPEKDITMTNACMTAPVFKNFFNHMMFGKLNDKSMFTEFEALFKAVVYINDNFANAGAQLAFSKLMGKGFFGLKVKGGAKLKVKIGAKKPKLGLKVKIGAKKPKVGGKLKVKIG